FAANVRQAQRVAVTTNTSNGTVHDAGGVGMVDGAKAQRIHDSDGACAHGDDVADNAANAGCGTLVRLDHGGGVVGFNLERYGPAVAQVSDASVFADAHQHVLLHFLGDLVPELAQVVLGGLVGAV